MVCAKTQRNMPHDILSMPDWCQAAESGCLQKRKPGRKEKAQAEQEQRAPLQKQESWERQAEEEPQPNPQQASPSAGPA